MTSALPHPSVAFSIKLPRAGEHYRPCRHVQPKGKRLRGEERLDEALLEENLRRLLEDGEEARVVDPDASLEEGEHVFHLRQLLVVVRENVDGIVEDLLH